MDIRLSMLHMVHEKTTSDYVVLPFGLMKALYRGLDGVSTLVQHKENRMSFISFN